MEKTWQSKTVLLTEVKNFLNEKQLKHGEFFVLNKPSRLSALDYPHLSSVRDAPVEAIVHYYAEPEKE